MKYIESLREGERINEIYLNFRVDVNKHLTINLCKMKSIYVK